MSKGRPRAGWVELNISSVLSISNLFKTYAGLVHRLKSKKSHGFGTV